MSNRYYLVRHGQDEDNAQGLLNGHRDNPLTQKGIDQAHETAEKIKNAGMTFDVVYASPLQRTYQTGRIICDALGIDAPIREALLIERDFGVMTGKPVDRILPECMPDVFITEHTNYFLNPEGSETFPKLLERACKLLDKLDAEHEDKNILLATHGDIGQMIYAQYYHKEWKEVLESFHFGNSDLLLLSEESPAEQAHVQF